MLLYQNNVEVYYRENFWTYKCENFSFFWLYKVTSFFFLLLWKQYFIFKLNVGIDELFRHVLQIIYEILAIQSISEILYTFLKQSRGKIECRFRLKRIILYRPRTVHFQSNNNYGFRREMISALKHHDWSYCITLQVSYRTPPRSISAWYITYYGSYQVKLYTKVCVNHRIEQIVFLGFLHDLQNKKCNKWFRSKIILNVWFILYRSCV